MNHWTKRISALFLALILSVSLLTGIVVPASAASVTYNTGYVSGYGQVIKNWGSRGTVATFLSPNAEAFYNANGTSYEELSLYAGSTNTNSVPGSALYQQLQTLMASNQDKITSYGDTRSMYRFTDCQNGVDNAISSFYSGKSIGPGWDSGKTWNREHTWPNSKGNASGEGENDIMMLRPTAKSENGSRSNTAYGESIGYYHPNTESGGKYDVRGDVARIMLYVYVRWGNAERMWGKSGVMESREVLLKWLEQDPVDTWELGRNDSVESITGTRNVFVDYPELAFILFGAEIPENMATPSNGKGVNIQPQPTEPTEPKPIPGGFAGQISRTQALSAGQYLGESSDVTGKVTEILLYNSKYHSYNFNLDVDGVSVYCYSLNAPTGVELKVGDTVNVKGELLNYNGTVEFEYKRSTMTILDDPEPQPTEPTEPKPQCEPGKHVYDDIVDGTCNVCNAKRENVETRQVVHMFRMYNPNTGEHFYTGSTVERDNLIGHGWQYEGVGFTFPANTGAPVYRLFQPSTGEHLYTMVKAEKEKLEAEGWNYEGIAFNSAYNTEAVQHRLHNPNATVGAYHFTFSEEERQNLINEGWEYQGIGWYSCFK